MGKRKADCTPEEWAAVLEYMRAYSRSPRGRAKDKARYNDNRKNKITASARLRKYGVTPEQTKNMLFVQNNQCGVCKRPLATEGEQTRDQHIDHCHETKKVRGVLCGRCNIVEGSIRKVGLTPLAFAMRLQAYLDNPPAEVAELI